MPFDPQTQESYPYDPYDPWAEARWREEQWLDSRGLRPEPELDPGPPSELEELRRAYQDECLPPVPR